MKKMYVGFVKKDIGGLTDMSDKICPLVYTGIATDPSGGVRPCCVFDQKYNYRGSIAEYKDSKIWKEVEKDFLDGKYHPGCHHCERQDSAGSSSKRTREVQNYKAKYNRDTLDIEHMKSIGYDLIDLRLSNKCNLKCVSCNPKSSSLIFDETKKHYDDTMHHYKHIYDLAKDRDLTNPYSDENIEDLMNCISKDSRLYFTGGEPSVVKGVLKILQRLIDEGLNKDVDIEFNSNFQTTNPKFIDLLSHFPRGLMMPSLDGIGARAEYIRFPSDWKRISDNMKYFNEKCPTWRFNIAPTISVLSIFYLDELLDFCYHNDYFINFTNMLWGPGYLNIAILPDKYKQLALQKLEHAQDKYKQLALPIPKPADQKRGTTDWAGNIRGLDNLRNYLYSADSDLERLKACKINLEKLDKVRGNSYIKSLPILKEMFDECL
jgi:organic radical activating enzyme